MTRNIELSVRADDTEVQRALGRISRAIAGAKTRDRWARTRCSHTLTEAGFGVTHNPACDPRPITVRWSETAHDALPDLRSR